MTISTRTPEGDPLKCSICGSEHFVLTSWPPGDSVCPSCGAHSWIPNPIPELIAFNGKPKDCEFAEEIATTGESAMRMVVIHSVESLLIGVPLKTRSGPTAIIEVVQRATSHPDARTGYLRFVRSMAAVVESCPAFR